jgi:hypothetical protein
MFLPGRRATVANRQAAAGNMGPVERHSALPATALPTERPDYFPPAGGRYEVKPGLIRFGKPLGGGEADGHVFQLDATFPTYRRAKLAARQERLGKYFQTSGYSPEVQGAICDFIARRLETEHPALFQIVDGVLTCALTGERLGFDANFELRSVEPADGMRPPYACAFDALASQVQEDLAVVTASPEKSHWLSAIHLCSPNAWAAEDKIGRTFAMIHEPVAGMEQMNRQAEVLVDTMLNATDGFVRFAWGVTWDDELNHHPQPPTFVRRAGRFDPAAPRAFLRVERQTIWGFPEISSALFTIRTYLYDCTAIRRDPARRDALISALRTMSPESATYKGLAGSRRELLEWLKQFPSPFGRGLG